jgi:LacI family transcriptional regulator
MSNTISIREVAERAGVAVGTVSNTLNKPEKVSRKVQARVQAAIAELGYVRNESARALKVGRSREIGLLVTDLTNPFFTDVARGADDAADDVGDVVSLCSSTNSAAREVKHLQRLASQRVKGILVNPLELDDLNLDDLLGSSVPVVVIARRARGQDRCSVSTDDVTGGELAANHLIEQGHRRLAFVGPFPDRMRGVRLAIASHEGSPVTFQTYAHESPASHEGGRQFGDQLAAMDPAERPTGIICGNDLMALGVLQAMTIAGIRVPQDVAIVGYDDISYAAGAAVPLSSVRQPREEMGRSAVRLLLEEIADQDTHRHRAVVFTPELIVRASSDHRRHDEPRT